MPGNTITPVYIPPGAAATPLEQAKMKKGALEGTAVLVGGLVAYGFAEDVGWAKWVGGAALALVGYNWLNARKEVKALSPKNLVDVMTAANKEALAKGLTGDAAKKLVHQRVAEQFGEDQAQLAVPISSSNGSSSSSGVPDEPPPTGMNGGL